MLTRVSRLLAALAATLILCQGCASTPPPNPNFSAAAVMNPAPPKASATAAAITKATSTGMLLDRIVAVVNNDVILKSQLDQHVAAITKEIEARGTTLPPGHILRKQVLDQMVLTHLQLQQAADKGITVSDDALNQALNRIAERNGITLSQLPAKLRQQGLDYATFRQDLRRQIIINDLQKQVVSQQMHITPREVQTQIQEDEANSDANTQYHLAQILIATPSNPTPAQVEEARKKADMVYRKIRKGTDFAAVAVEYSQGQQALKGGDLGWLKGSELPTIFANVIRQMKPGDITEPLSSPSGFHILKLDGVKQASNKIMVTQTHVRHILLKTSAVVTDAEARAKLEQLRKQILAGADFAKLAREYSQDPGSASKGGDLGWLNPGATVPEFQAQFDKLQVGQISQPFKTPFGWHIVQVLGRRQEDETREYTRNKAYEELYARKSEEILRQWVSALKDSAYIEYHLGN